MTPHLHDSLRANSPGRSGGWREKKESLPLRLWNLNSTFNSPVAPRRLSCQISVNQLEAETSAIVNKHWKHVPRVMASLLMSSPPISISHRLIHFPETKLQALLLFAAQPPERPEELARRLFTWRTRELPWRLKKWLCWEDFAIWMVIVLMSVLMSSSRDEFSLK